MVPLSLGETEIRSILPAGVADCQISITTDGGTITAPEELGFDVSLSRDFSLSIVPDGGTVVQSGTTTFTISAMGPEGFADLIGLEIGALPDGVTASVAPATLTAGQSVTMTVTASSNASIGLELLSILGTARIDGSDVTQAAQARLWIEPGGRTAVAGQFVLLDGGPLAGVIVRLGNEIGISDGGGNFLLLDVPTGQHKLSIDATPADARLPIYGVEVTLTAGQLTQLEPFKIHPPLPPERYTQIDNTTADRIIADPNVPGASFTIPAGVTITGWDGQPKTQMAIQRLLPDELPVPPPPGPAKSFYQPFFGTPMGGLPSAPIPVTLPNDHDLEPGQKAEIWYYDSPPFAGAEAEWRFAGMGTVSSDGATISSDPGVGITRFCGVCGLSTCINPNQNNQPSTNKNAPSAGDPVNLALGQMTVEKTDLVLPGRISAVVRRHFSPYEPYGGLGGFDLGMGSGWALSVQVVLQEDSPTVRRLVLPGNSRYMFTRQADGTFVGTDMFFLGAVLSGTADGEHILRFKGGTLWRFAPKSPVAGISLLVEQTDRNGNRLSIERDTTGRLQAIVEPAGRRLTFTYSANRISQVRDPIGRTVTYGYDGSGRLATVTDPAGGRTRYTYDGAGRIVSITDPRNITFITNEHDSLGRVTRQVQADGGIWTFSYVRPQCAPPARCGVDTGPTSVVVTDPRGHSTTHRLSPDGYLLELQDALGSTTRFKRDRTGHVFAITDALGRVTHFQRDDAGNPTEVMNPAGHVTEVEYDPTFNLPRRVVDALGHASSLEYDARGNLVAMTDALGERTLLAYDGKGQLIEVTDPNGAATRFSHDAFGNSTLTIDPLGGVTRRSYDVVSRLVAVTDARGRTVEYEHDVLDRLVGVIDPSGERISFAYDPNGNLTEVSDPNGNAIQYGYDVMDRQISRTDPLGMRETSEYDAMGNLTLHRDRKGDESHFFYDPLNRLVSAQHADGSHVLFTYDAVGRLSEATDSLSGTILNAYDLLDRLVAQTTPHGRIEHDYDALGRVTRTQVQGQASTFYVYDEVSRLIRASQAGRQVRLAYDPAGRRTRLELPAGLATDYAYDAASRLRGVSYTLNGDPIGEIPYTYDRAGNRTSASGSAFRALLPDPVAGATYDAANRQLSFGDATMQYDPNGSLVALTDPNGMTHVHWDARGRLVAVYGPAVTARFAYDTFGRRTHRTVNNQTTRYLYDEDSLALEISGGLPLPYLNGVFIDEVWARGGNEVFLADALGSIVEVRDGLGIASAMLSYEPFGRAVISGYVDGSTIAFAGRETDSTGLYYNRARFLNPRAGRFVAEDPLDIGGGEVNLYVYAHNDPANLTDPFGRQATGPPLQTPPEAPEWVQSHPAPTPESSTLPLALGGAPRRSKSDDDFEERIGCGAHAAEGFLSGFINTPLEAAGYALGYYTDTPGDNNPRPNIGLHSFGVDWGSRQLAQPCRDFGSIVRAGRGIRRIMSRSDR